MKGPMFEEIKSFYNKVREEGMYWSDYLENKKYLRNKIDDKVNDLLSLNRQLWYQGRITKKQYQNMQIRLENSRFYYKRLVYYC